MLRIALRKHSHGSVLLYAAILGFFFQSTPLQSDEAFVDHRNGEQRAAAVASDRTPESAAEVAREVLRLQEQLGGSVVRDRPQLQGWPAAHHSALNPLISSRREFSEHSFQAKVMHLREASWQLETTAHRLENLDLYEQADALRNVAGRLRRDARVLKQKVNSAADPMSRDFQPEPQASSSGQN